MIFERPPIRFNAAEYVLRAGGAAPAKMALTVALDAELTNFDTHTYAELTEQVLLAGAGLLRLGLTTGERVLIRLDNDANFAIAFLGALAVGLVPVSASMQLTSGEVGFLARDAGCRAVLCSPNLPPVDELPSGCSQVALSALRQWLEPTNSPTAFAETAPNDPAYIVYTSGTTGTPKGVLHGHRSVWGRRPMRAGWTDMGPDDVVLHTGSLNWTYTMGVGLMDPLSVGAQSVLYAGKRDVDVWPRLIQKTQTTIFVSVPTLYRQLLRSDQLTPSRTASLRHGLAAGEPLPAAILDTWRKATKTELYESLGMSEVSTYVSSGPSTPIRPGSPGRAQPYRRVAIIPTAPGDGDEPLPTNETGLLAVHRDDPGLMLGYWQSGSWQQPDDDKTEEGTTFRGDWFVGGDTAHLDADGYLWFHGRNDDVVNSFGHRVSPLEIERALVLHADVAEVGVCEVQVRADLKVVGAFVVPTSPDAQDPDALLAFAAEHLAAYKLPRVVRFVASLPKTANGKMRRRSLPELPELLTFRFIDTREPLYESEHDLRYQVLRKPLGFTLEDVCFPQEDESWHLVAVTGGKVVGCVLFHPRPDGSGKLFQMAVTPRLQGQGVGRRLVEALEERVRDEGLREVVLNARDIAIGFYEKLGYHVFGEPFEEVGIGHQKMRKVFS